jgi:hypothetical protein
VIRAEDLDPAQQSRVDSARRRFAADAERLRQLMLADGADDAEIATALLSGLGDTMAAVLVELLPPMERARHVSALSAALHVALLKHTNEGRKAT